MKLKNLLLTAAVTGVLATSAAMAAGTASSKFAATWTDTPALASVAAITGATVDTTTPVEQAMGYTIATIKIPQDKELLVGVSAEVGLVTDTSIKGKNGGTAKAIADAGASVTLFAVPQDNSASTVTAAPGAVTLSRRIQAMTATLAGVIQSCTDTTGGTDGAGLNPGDDGYTDTPDGTIVIADECIVTDEEIGLALDTVAAQHFNFILPNMDQGVYDIKAVFHTAAQGEVQICDENDQFTDSAGNSYDCLYDPEGTVEGSTYSKAIINKTMVTVQEVRAAKGGLIDTEIIVQ